MAEVLHLSCNETNHFGTFEIFKATLYQAFPNAVNPLCIGFYINIFWITGLTRLIRLRSLGQGHAPCRNDKCKGICGYFSADDRIIRLTILDDLFNIHLVQPMSRTETLHSRACTTRGMKKTLQGCDCQIIALRVS